MADVVVRYWAGARRAAGRDEERLAADTVGALRAALGERRTLAQVVAVASFLVDETPAGDGTRLYDGAVIDVLPPFAGG
ncbi:MAG: sulfur-carrier protein [Pseudonocardiales bacterium]|nr:sulfur-carrier protein [Pseudonocardiales bacterium]